MTVLIAINLYRHTANENILWLQRSVIGDTEKDLLCVSKLIVVEN